MKKRILAIGKIPSAIMYPIKQGGMIPLTWLICMPLYHEKTTRKNVIAMILGVIGVVLLSL